MLDERAQGNVLVGAQIGRDTVATAPRERGGERRGDHPPARRGHGARHLVLRRERAPTPEAFHGAPRQLHHASEILDTWLQKWCLHLDDQARAAQRAHPQQRLHHASVSAGDAIMNIRPV